MAEFGNPPGPRAPGELPRFRRNCWRTKVPPATSPARVIRPAQRRPGRTLGDQELTLPLVPAAYL